MDIIKKTPVALCGLMLGVASLGNLLKSFSEGIYMACGIAAGMLMLLFVLRCILFPQKLSDDMKSPVMASIAGTFSMALMQLTVYAQPWLGSASMYIWFLAIVLHIALIVYFTWKFFFKLQMTNVYASYFIVYVGIVVASITAPAYEKNWIGKGAFWFGLCTFAVLLVLVTARYVKHKEVSDSAKPFICIYAAPMSLCIAGYIQSFKPVSYNFLLAMYAVACLLYVFALIKAITYLKLPFYPSDAAFTFPFVISAIASKQLMGSVAALGHTLPALNYIVPVQTAVAAIAVLYTFIRFAVFLFTKPDRAAAVSNR